MVYVQADTKWFEKDNLRMNDKFKEFKVEGFFARFSPNGKKIASIIGGWPKTEIAITNEDGTGQRIISSKEAILKLNY